MKSLVSVSLVVGLACCGGTTLSGDALDANEESELHPDAFSELGEESQPDIVHGMDNDEVEDVENLDDVLPPFIFNTWLLEIGSDDSDSGGSLIFNMDGSFFVVGSLGGFGSDGHGWPIIYPYILQMDMNGNITDQMILSNTMSAAALFSGRSPDGGVIIAGHKEFTFEALRDYDVWVAKVRGDGEIAWQKSFGTRYADETTLSLAATTDGDFLIASVHTSPFEDGYNDVLLMKFDSDGNFLWGQGYDTGTDDSVSGVIETSDGSLLAVGSPSGTELGGSWLMKLDNAGNIIWSATISQNEEVPGAYHAADVVESRQGGFIVAGSYQSYFGYDTDVWILRIDDSRNIAWQRTLGSSLPDGANTVLESSDGGIVIAGTTISGYDPPYADSDIDIFVAKLDGDGNLSWQRVIATEYDDVITDLMEAQDGKIVFTGYSGRDGYDVSPQDIWVGVLSPMGDMEGACDIIREGDLILGESSAVATAGSMISYEASATEQDTSPASIGEADATGVFLCPEEL